MSEVSQKGVSRKARTVTLLRESLPPVVGSLGRTLLTGVGMVLSSLERRHSRLFQLCFRLDRVLGLERTVRQISRTHLFGSRLNLEEAQVES